MGNDPGPHAHRRSELLAAGLSDAGIRRDQRAGRLAAFRHGFYVTPDDIIGMDAEARHRMLMRTCETRPGLVFSHVSAVVAHGCPLWGASLGRVQLTRDGSSGASRSGHRQVHAAQLRPDEVVALSEGWATRLDRALVDVARSSPAPTALIAADHAAHHRMVTPTELMSALTDARQRPGSSRARRVLALVDGRSESPGETRTRLALADLLPLESQVEIRDDDGRFVARVDLGCEEAMLVIEFDGDGKYLPLLKPGQTTVEAVLAEKRREDRVRELGYLVIRVIWADLANPAALRARVRRMYQRGVELRQAGHRPAGTFTPAALIA